MLGMGFEPLFWRSQNETESLPLRRSGRVRIQHAGCRPPLRIRLQIGRRGDYQSPAGSRVQGSAPNAPTVGRGAHTPPLPGWCNHRGTGRTWYRGGMWACRPTPAAVVRVLCTRGRAAASRPYDGHPGGLGAAGIAGLFGRIVWYNTYFAAQKRGCLEKETASVQFIPLR